MTQRPDLCSQTPRAVLIYIGIIDLTGILCILYINIARQHLLIYYPKCHAWRVCTRACVTFMPASSSVCEHKESTLRRLCRQGKVLCQSTVFIYFIYIYSRENNYLLHLFLNNATLQIPSLVTIVWSGLEKRPMSSRGTQKYLPTEGTRSYNHRSRYSRSRTRFHVVEERDTWIIKWRGGCQRER